MRLLHLLFITLGLLWAPVAPAQVFSSGSSGVDGALSFVCVSPQVIDWDPAGLDLDEDGVFEFTTIDVGTDCTVRLLTSMVGFGPVVWLATGNVVIDGILELNGEAGHSGTSGLRVTALPGPGGFPGGLGKISGTGVITDGFGPGGGSGVECSNCKGGGAGHFLAGNPPASGGAAYGNVFLRPLLGGSGGGGSRVGGGGGGAGAILVASTTSITVDGEIHANGGLGGNDGGKGSGGAIRLVAPQVVGTGSITTAGGSGGSNPASKGRIRIESDNPTFQGNLQSADVVGVSLLPNTPLLDDPSIVPSLRITFVGGIPTPIKPTGGFSPVDVTIDTATTVTVMIESTNVPAGTVVTVEVHNQNTGTQTFDSEPLAVGSDPLSADALNVAIDSGLSRIFLRANF